MEKFTKWLDESLTAEGFAGVLDRLVLDEANICKGVSDWVFVTDENIGSYPENIKLVMKYMLKKWPKYIKAFMLPEVSKLPQNNKYELYVCVDTSELSNNNQTGRKELYNKLTSELTAYEQLTPEFKIGPASNDDKNKFNSNGFRLSFNDIKNTALQNTQVSIGLFTENEDELVLDTLVRYRIEEYKTEATETKKIRCNIQNANALLANIFGSNEWRIGGFGGLRPSQFASKLIDVLKQKNILNSKEGETYRSIFGMKTFPADFDPKFLKDINVDSTTTAADFIYDSNILAVLSELIIPWLLINGVRSFKGVNLIEKLSGDPDDSITAVSWPTSASNKNTDYSVSFAQFQSGKEVGISAKFGTGHLTSAITVMRDYLTDFCKGKLMINRAARAMKLCIDTYSGATNVFICWCMAAALNGEVSESTISQLYDLYKRLTTNDKGPRLNKFAPDDEKLIETVYGISVKNIPDNAKPAWPYSITYLLEKKMVDALNADKDSKIFFYNIKMGNNEKYHQIELYTNKSDVISIKVKSPVAVNKKTDVSAKIDFRCKTGPGNNSIRKNNSIATCVAIARSGGGKGQIIGVKQNS